MASLFSKVARLAKSPQGKRMITEAKRLAKDPNTRKQAKDAVDKFRGKGKGTPPRSGH
ncbi:hypothetical protein SAMN05421630_107351 [Prauserella marina]|uniref:Uncharacterized protein n=1 Tax=Prauserella marina TaxID=530584 RepID=A0A1G6TXA3_9PSEU|nr:hypothetical protein [Prauserella marina]PWV75474.1 hypothetical protein DES30_10689 [Prauserella marina]SDD33738.1 hypothetical protein SAMN05421630_107351 [Prauserella marina]